MSVTFSPVEVQQVNGITVINHLSDIDENFINVSNYNAYRLLGILCLSDHNDDLMGHASAHAIAKGIGEYFAEVVAGHSNLSANDLPYVIGRLSALQSMCWDAQDKDPNAMIGWA